MPTISIFYGIVIQMYWNEHAPPHFHAIYGDAKATIDINSLTVGEGSLPTTSDSTCPGLGEIASSGIARRLGLVQCQETAESHRTVELEGE